MSLLDTLYREAILDHYRKPRNHRSMPHATLHREGLNPSCGDEVAVFLLLDGDTITDASFTGSGCAISQSSASLLTEALKGRSVAEARALSGNFRAMIRGEPPVAELGDLQLLQGVSQLHARVKCATLAWVTLDEALDSVGERG
jgi:nitrogen fixation NifU-like protein